MTRRRYGDVSVGRRARLLGLFMVLGLHLLLLYALMQGNPSAPPGLVRRPLMVSLLDVPAEPDSPSSAAAVAIARQDSRGQFAARPQPPAAVLPPRQPSVANVPVGSAPADVMPVLTQAGGAAVSMPSSSGAASGGEQVRSSPESARPVPVRTAAVIDARTACARPEYPSAALRAGQAGLVGLSFLIGSDGRVQESRVEQSSGFRVLDEAARRALSRCVFIPATSAGQAVPSWGKLEYEWRLEAAGQ